MSIRQVLNPLLNPCPPAWQSQGAYLLCALGKYGWLDHGTCQRQPGPCKKEEEEER